MSEHRCAVEWVVEGDRQRWFCSLPRGHEGWHEGWVANHVGEDEGELISLFPGMANPIRWAPMPAFTTLEEADAWLEASV